MAFPAGYESETFNSSGMWTVPSGVTAVVFAAFGVGGSGSDAEGGGSGGGATGGAGGGGGAFALSSLTATSGDDWTITINDSGSSVQLGLDAAIVSAAAGFEYLGGSASASIGNVVTRSGGDGGAGGTSTGGGGGSTPSDTSAAVDGAAGNSGGAGGGGPSGSTAALNGGSGGNAGGGTGSAPGGGGGGGDSTGITTGASGAAGRVVVFWIPAPTAGVSKGLTRIAAAASAQRSTAGQSAGWAVIHGSMPVITPVAGQCVARSRGIATGSRKAAGVGHSVSMPRDLTPGAAIHSAPGAIASMSILSTLAGTGCHGHGAAVNLSAASSPPAVVKGMPGMSMSPSIAAAIYALRRGGAGMAHGLSAAHGGGANTQAAAAAGTDRGFSIAGGVATKTSLGVGLAFGIAIPHLPGAITLAAPGIDLGLSRPIAIASQKRSAIGAAIALASEQCHASIKAGGASHLESLSLPPPASAAINAAGSGRTIGQSRVLVPGNIAKSSGPKSIGKIAARASGGRGYAVAGSSFSSSFATTPATAGRGSAGQSRPLSKEHTGVAAIRAAGGTADSFTLTLPHPVKKSSGSGRSQALILPQTPATILAPRPGCTVGYALPIGRIAFAAAAIGRSQGITTPYTSLPPPPFPPVSPAVPARRFRCNGRGFPAFQCDQNGVFP